MIFVSVPGCRWSFGAVGGVDDNATLTISDKFQSKANLDGIDNIKLISEKITKPVFLAAALQAVQAGGAGEYFVLGDFNPAGPSRYSYLGLDPSEVLSFNYRQAGDPFAGLTAAGQRYQLNNETPLPVPFVGGWVGFLSYDLGRYIEKLPDGVVHDIPLPLMRFGFHDHLLAWDQRENCGYLLALEYEGQASPVDCRLDRLRRIYNSSLDNEPVATASEKKFHAAAGELIQKMQQNISHEEYLAKVARARGYIRAGDIFEVNLSQRFSCPYRGSGDKLYDYLCRYNPAGYSALLMAPEYTIVSSSPELFLCRRGESIVTRPIKGTIPRGLNEEQDRQNLRQLEHSEKDIAELNMIIDLERNDLGKVCRYGTVQVRRQREIEPHPTVYHAVATIAGRLRAGTTNGQILRATFPGGSISGAPKIRAMEIIDELEPTARSVYTGSIGYLGVNGDMDLNIAIRTIILAQGQAYMQVGGAIVADSTPQAEYDETIAKAAALVNAIQTVT